jgi:hypothetical protein
MLLCKPIATAVIEGTYYGDAQRDVEARQRARLEERSRMTALIRRNKKVVSYFSTLMAGNKQQSQAAAQTVAQKPPRPPPETRSCCPRWPNPPANRVACR